MIWLITNWKIVAVGTLVFVLGAYGMTMRTQRDIARAEYSDFRREVAIAAQAAAEQALKTTIENEEKREKADVENLRLRAALDATTRRLRDARAASSFVPAAPSCPDRPASACFDRSELERAIQRLDAGVSGLLEEGDRAVIDLETAKRWATDR